MPTSHESCQSTAGTRSDTTLSRRFVRPVFKEELIPGSSLPYVTEDNLTDVVFERWKDIPDGEIPDVRSLTNSNRGQV
jgi:hypothetical protein